MNDYFLELTDSLAGTFTDPAKRVFVGYLLSAWLIAFLWLVFFRRSGSRQALGEIFSKRVWFSTSARADYLLLLLNRVVMLAISPLLLTQLTIATLLFENLHHLSTPGFGATMPGWSVGLLFTVTLFILDDASRYLVHRLMHRSKLLWRFHRVHHTATTLTPLTIFRTHPVEGVLFLLRSAVVQGVCVGLFVFAFGGGIDLVDVLGANLFIFLFNVFGANLRHSTIPIYYPKWLERWLMSPAQHQLHHSSDPRHFDCNYGVFLSIWDRLGKSLRFSEPESDLTYGVSDQQGKSEHGLRALYWQPFVDVLRLTLADCMSTRRRSEVRNRNPEFR